VLAVYEGIQADFGGKVSIADLIVLGGNRRRRAGGEGRGPWRDRAVHLGRGDATADWTDADSFACSSRVPTASATISRCKFNVCRPRSCWSIARSCSACRSRDDRAGRRPARARRQPSKAGPMASSPIGSGSSPTTSSSTSSTWARYGRKSTKPPTRSSSAPIAPPARRNGPRRAPTWCSDRTRSCGRSRKSMPRRCRREVRQRLRAAWTKVMDADRFDRAGVRQIAGTAADLPSAAVPAFPHAASAPLQMGLHCRKAQSHHG
jgi:hypothetical protein